MEFNTMHYFLVFLLCAGRLAAGELLSPHARVIFLVESQAEGSIADAVSLCRIGEDDQIDRALELALVDIIEGVAKSRIPLDVKYSESLEKSLSSLFNCCPELTSAEIVEQAQLTDAVSALYEVARQQAIRARKVPGTPLRFLDTFAYNTLEQTLRYTESNFDLEPHNSVIVQRVERLKVGIRKFREIFPLQYN
jgi:hypothetical protein